MNKSNFWMSLGIVVTLGFLLGILGFSTLDKVPMTLDPVVWSPQTQWITSSEPNYRFYTRRTFNLPDTALSGWLRVSADNDFVLYVNGKKILAESSVLKNGFGLASNTNPSSQDFQDRTRYISTTGTNYLIANPKDWKLTYYTDLTQYLKPGKNVIALAIVNERKNPRLAIEGAVYPVADSPIDLTTGSSSWYTWNLPENLQQLQWFSPDLPDQNWLEAKVINRVEEVTYSRLSKNLFERPLQGSWITGNVSPQGESWIRTTWDIAKLPHRAWIRFAGSNEYSLLINGKSIGRYKTNSDDPQMHLLDVTNLLQIGTNNLAVRLASPITQDGGAINRGVLEPSVVSRFILDGWIEDKSEGGIESAISTSDSSWRTITAPTSGWSEGISQDESPAKIIGSPNPKEFDRVIETSAYLLNYPENLWHQIVWSLVAIVTTSIIAWGIGFSRKDVDSHWSRFELGATLLLPSTLFLIGIGLLRHRYAEAETGLFFCQPQSNSFILLGFVVVIGLTLIINYCQQNYKRNKKNNITSEELRLNFVKSISSQGIWFYLGLIAFISLSVSISGNPFLIWILACGIAGAILPLIMIWKRIAKSTKSFHFNQILGSIQKAWSIWGDWILLGLIVGIGFALRTYNLSFIDLDPDENISLDAARGILRTGAPIQTSGIYYTRGPFYQYFLAVWLGITGISVTNARFLSALFSTATLMVVYPLARKITGKAWIALLVVAVLAIDPWQLFYARNIRFYQISQLTTIITFIFFLKGFIEKSGKIYQYLFSVFLTLALLSQEVGIALIPVFLIGVLYFYRPFSLKTDWTILLSNLMVLIIYAFNIAIVSFRTLTPIPAISSSTGSQLKFHLEDVTGFLATFFVGPDRIRTLYSFFFLMGLVYFLKRRDGKLLFLFSTILINILILTLITYQTFERYLFAIYPIFVLLSIYSCICILGTISEKLQSRFNNLLPLRGIALCFALLIVFSNLEIGRVIASYKEPTNRRATEIYEYIRDNKRLGDVVISPSPVYAPFIIGKVDYSLLRTYGEIFDTTYWRNGELIDRFGGGIVLTSVDQLNAVLEKSKRVWIHVDEVRTGSLPRELQLNTQVIGRPVLDTFGGHLRLWQPEDGLLQRLPNRGKDLGAY
jgi:hypothetical protein